jgi:hypothetical protein
MGRQQEWVVEMIESDKVHVRPAACRAAGIEWDILEEGPVLSHYLDT